MSKIPYETILDIQKKVDIVDVIGRYLPLEQKGKNFFALCPFHDDHNPSMSISKEKQIYTCFVCGASGNVFNFVMDYEKISFSEAVCKVASLAGIPISQSYESHKENVSNVNKKALDIFLLASKYYQNNIRTVYGKKAIEYLQKREINDDVIKHFEIGLSLNDNGISKLLQNKGYSKDELLSLGICGDKDGYLYDQFRNRIMFPLYDLDGHTVGFSGRIYNGEDESKYVNSKESEIFKKGFLLYNYHNAIKEAREARQIIIVEGFMDVIRLYTVGVKNVVASMGTAITKEHANLLKRLSKNVVLCFDGDAAGEKATQSAVEALEEVGLESKIIRLEDDLDPDDYIKKKGVEAFLTHLKNPLSKLDFKLIMERKKTDFEDYKDISSYIQNVAGDLSKISDKIEYELTVKKLSKETGVDVDTINSYVKDIPKQSIKIIDKPVSKKMDKYEKAENYLIYYMLNEVDAILLYEKKLAKFNDPILQKIAIMILEFYDKNRYINTLDFVTSLEDNKALINKVLQIDACTMPKMSINDVNEYIETIDEGMIKREIEKVKRNINEETDIAKKVALLSKLTMLKKKECAK